MTKKPSAASDAFDPTPYLRPPVLDVPAAVGLSVAMIAAMQKGAPQAVKQAAKRLHQAASALQAKWAEKPADKSRTDPRLADRALDNAWAALAARLTAYAELAADRHPKAKRAAELEARVFPDGLTFLKLAYAAEWAESEKRLHQIDESKLAGDLDSACGPEFLAEVRLAHRAYGEALGITKPGAPPPEAPALLEPLRSVQSALAGYALQVAAWVDADAGAVSAARGALRPLDDFRASKARRSGADLPAPPAPPPPPATPTTPLPEPPQ